MNKELLKEQYTEAVLNLAFKEDLSNIFTELLILHLDKKIPINDEDFLKTYYHHYSLIIRNETQRAAASVNKEQAVFNKWLLEDAREEEIEHVNEKDYDLMQQQAFVERTFKIKRYHYTTLLFVKDTIEKMKEKYQAESIGEITAHLYKDLLPVVEKYKRTI